MEISLESSPAPLPQQRREVRPSARPPRFSPALSIRLDALIAQLERADLTAPDRARLRFRRLIVEKLAGVR